MGQGTLTLINRRAADLNGRLGSLLSKDQLGVSFLPSHETNFIRYFSNDLHKELASCLGEKVIYLPPEKADKADIVILTAHGRDLSSNVWQLRDKIREETIVAIWLWDNHLAHLNNYRTVLGADCIFPSHAYTAGYLCNPLSVMGGHVPACTAQWTRDEVRNILSESPLKPRMHKALVNYVDYPLSWRSELLRRMKDEAPEVDVFLMSPDDRSRYFGKDSIQRFLEWGQYKATVILPVEKDLSTRVFDALLSGQVPVVPTAIKDFDYVISPEMQKELGIVRLEDISFETVRTSINLALEVFDGMSESGVRRRQEFVLEHHMLPHRIRGILNYILDIARTSSVVAGIGQLGYGLYVVPNK